MIIRIKNRQRKKKLALAGIRTRLGALLRASGLPDAQLGVLFVGERAMRTLNHAWRGIDRTTDVLSFSFREGPFSGVQPRLLGDIVICVPAADRQGRAAGLPLSSEIDRLLVHGLAHVLGYDHERGPREAERMRRKERQLLKRISR